MRDGTRIVMAVLGVVTAATGCAVPEDADQTRLPNSVGKDDSATVRFKLTASNPALGLVIGCDQPAGCEGSVIVKLKAPEHCALFPDNARCGITHTGPLSRDVANLTLTSSTEGSRTLPLQISTGDGTTWVAELAGAFSARGDEDVEILLERAGDPPDLTIDVRAEWTTNAHPGAAADEVQRFLGELPGSTYSEVGTQYAGYRAFRIEMDQLLDPANPAAGTFKQAMVLHHKDKAAPVILYTSGYGLFEDDYLSELGVALGANQISTEQRFFGTSLPANATPASWLAHVDIAKAAADHHHVVGELKPFYAGSWLSTGHSKGGMTSIFHRRFYPDDVDATVAYVAPISHSVEDPRYVAFADQIGEQPCRDGIRNLQRAALGKFDELLAIAQANPFGETFDRAGGAASGLEKGIILLEWIFWQHYGITQCASYLTTPTDAQSIYDQIVAFVGNGMSDQMIGDSLTYYFQAETQLGKQAFATAHLADLLKHQDTVFDWSLPGTDPVHDPAPMRDIQDWVNTSASEVLFLYGAYDPWTGGAYDVPQRPAVVKVSAPAATHGAMIAGLAEADKKLALDTIEAWIGKRPTLTPRAQPRPARPAF